jgi:hypothetical protein
LALGPDHEQQQEDDKKETDSGTVYKRILIDAKIRKWNERSKNRANWEMVSSLLAF